ncbi:unnamed protein product [Ceutorhynchus assimilis]|uniref:HTH psq-type domain-containing protein n=1 Tax=Ceutorhynchus assimilis TaxID=467358 RepID=A0A9N9QPY4_9CUCU|nr:unnamed protein product [Ceutorhynchus assimilis]
MSRVYEGKTTRGAYGGRYSRAELQSDVQDIMEGRKTIRGAAELYNIPKTTLKHYVRGTRGKGIVSSAGKGGGGKLSLPVEHEKQLVKCIKTMERRSFGPSRQEVLDVVQVYTQSNNS